MASDPIALAGVPASRPRESRRPARGGKLRLRRNAPLRDALLSAFANVLGHAKRSATNPGDDPERSVHDYRKSIRRARSVVALLRPALGKKTTRAFAAELADAFRATGALRDADVLAATLAALAGDDAGLFVEAAEITARMGASRPSDPAGVLAAAIPILRRLPAALEVSLPRDYSTSDLEEGVERGYRRAQEALRRAQVSRTDVDFHFWRKRVKELRYQVELLASTGTPPLKAREKELGILARELGEVTDLLLVCQRIEALRGPDGDAGSRLCERGRDVARQRADGLFERSQALLADDPRAYARRVLAERG